MAKSCNRCAVTPNVIQVSAAGQLVELFDNTSTEAETRGVLERHFDMLGSMIATFPNKVPALSLLQRGFVELNKHMSCCFFTGALSTSCLARECWASYPSRLASRDVWTTLARTREGARGVGQGTSRPAPCDALAHQGQHQEEWDKVKVPPRTLSTRQSHMLWFGPVDLSYRLSCLVLMRHRTAAGW